MNSEPVSDKAKNAVWEAYVALEEKQKRAIARHTAKVNPTLFKYWVRIAGLSRGFDQRKVVNREVTYGVRLDNVLKEHNDGRFAFDVFSLFLIQTGTIDAVLAASIPDSVDKGEFERIVDEKAAKSDSEYAALVAAFVKCYPPERHGKAHSRGSVEQEMTGLVERLNKHAEKLEKWAASLRLTELVPTQSLAETVAAANSDAERLTELLRRYRKTANFPQIKFTTPEEVAEHVKELCAALAAIRERDGISSFLKSLAGALRALKVIHRSAKEERRLSDLRDNAVAEIEGAIATEKPKWVQESDRDVTEWLRWAFEIGGDELDQAQRCLKDDGYEHLSELIAIGDVEWLRDDHTLGGSGIETKELVIDTAGRDVSETVEASKDEDVAKSSEPEEPLTTEECVPTETQTKDIEIPTEEKLGCKSEKRPSDILIETEPVGCDIINTDTSKSQQMATPWENKDVREIARAVADSGDKTKPEAVAALAGKLALQREYALAYHLVLNAGQLYDMKCTIPAWVYGSVACGSAIQGTDQSANTVLNGFFQQYDEQSFDELQGTDGIAARLLVAAGSIESALFYPVTGAASVLQTLHLHKLPALQAVLKAVADYGSRGVGLPRAALFSTINADALEQKRYTIQARAKEWLLERAPQFDIISRAGKETWRAWIEKDGPVGSILNPLITGREAEISKIRALVEKYASSAAVDQEARRLFRHELNHRGELLRPALSMFRRHTAEAVQIANEWISIIESQPDVHQRFDEKILVQLRSCFSNHTKEALAELGDLSGESQRAAVRAGALACAQVVEDVTRVLKGTGTQSGRIRNAHQLLHDDLLRVVKVQLDADGSPRLPDYLIPTSDEIALKILAYNVVNGIASSVAEGLPTMQEAIRTRGDLGDHEATAQILKVLEMIETPESLRRLEQERTSLIARHRESARRKLTLGQRALSDALTKGLFAAQEYERWAVQHESADRDVRANGFLRFADVFALCERLNTELRERKTSEIARIRKEIERVNPSKEQRNRLDIVLNNEDVHTATDYLDRIRNQIELPDTRESESKPFLQFFGKGDSSACELIERELREANAVSDFVSRVANRKRVSGLQLSEMQTTQAKEAAQFLQLWFRTKSARELREPNGSKIFSFFGMLPKKMTKVAQVRGVGRGADVWDLQVEPLESRDLCPSAVFGSGAHGHYKVVNYWLRPAAEDILQHARDLGGGPVIVLYFGRMDSAERRSMSAEQGRADVIVIDDILAVFLAGQRKGRLLSLFLCSLPFSQISPYTKAASLLAPEMFYGRHREIRQLMSNGSDSSCLLYGGRQIGKTVLLRHVQRLFERSDPNSNVATYIDLKGKEIGTNRPMDEVWLVIAEELAKKKVIVEQIMRQIKHEWLFARIEEWLAGNTKRRILVLLDEADAFLAADAKGQDTKVPFSACTVLKDLMERTHRRFKLVFAGLHNVQKSTRVSNNPLAHFGEPICIGAMTDAAESREAEALIMEPLAAAGYFFESADLSARILAQTNYYPNLIQIYCDELLKYMQQRSRALFPSGKTPPYFIGAKILEDVYEQHALREELRLRFKWTLELDRRFELITNILALNDVDCTRGLEVTEIRQHAQLYWDRGFRMNDGKPVTYEGFRDLLEEMVGLGILRRAEPPDHYALRNPNVMNLIGSRSAVERLLEDAHKWDPIEVYDPTKFRGQISEHDKTLRSPLNAAQESKLKSGNNQVCVVCGCPAGHVDWVADAISYRFGKDGLVSIFKGHENLSKFQLELSKLGDRKSSGTTLIVVPDTVSWDRNWIKEATKRIAHYKKTKGAVCVVLVTGPTRLLSIVPDIVRRKFEGVNFTSIQPWDDSTVNQWLQESGHSAVDARMRTRLADLTGNWPLLLEESIKLMNSSVDDAEILEKKVKDEIFRPERKRHLYELFGLVETIIAPLQFLCENGSGWNFDEISELLGEGKGSISIEHVTYALTWAELLGLARRGPEGWDLDAGVKQVLSMG